MRLVITNKKTNERNEFEWRRVIFNGYEEQIDGSLMFKVIEGENYENRKIHFYPAEIVNVEFEL